MDKAFKVIDWKFDNDIEIYPIGDLHLGSIAHNEKEWVKFWQYIKSRPNAYLMLVGDLMNNDTRNSVGDIFHDDILSPSEQRKLLANYLAPIRDRILCCVSGNHESRKDNKMADCSPMELVCERLDLEHIYRDNLAIVSIRLGKEDYKNEANRTVSHYKQQFVFVVTHGSGGGSLTGSGVNKAEKFSMAFDGVDCYIQGHTHKPFITRPSKVVINRRGLTTTIKPVTVITCCSWLDYSGYAIKGQYLPAETCHPQKIVARADKGANLEILW